MGSEWRLVRLGDLVSIRHGWAFKGEHFSSDRSGRPIVVSVGNFRYTGGFRFESTNIKEYTADYPRTYELRPGEILLVMTCQTPGGEILGIPARVPDDGRVYLHNQRLGLVQLKSADVLEDYLYWLFLSRPFNRHLVATASGTKILHTAPSRIESFEFNLPRLDDQQAIASILGALDDKIELNRQMNETLEELTRTVFKSWFVDFDPVRAKAEGRQPVGMDAETAKLFPSRLVESELGEIPEGWEITTLGRLATLDKGVSYKGAFLANDGPALINLGNFGGGGKFLSEKLKHYRGDFRDRHVVREGDLIMANTDITQKREVIGSPAIVPFVSTHESTLFSHHVFAVRFNVPGIEWTTIGFFWLLQDDFRERAQGFATGTTVLAMPRDAVLEHRVAVPPAALRAQLVGVVSPMLELGRQNEKEASVLAELRDLLLPKLISGELRIPEAENLVEDVA